MSVGYTTRLKRDIFLYIMKMGVDGMLGKKYLFPVFTKYGIGVRIKIDKKIV